MVEGKDEVQCWHVTNQLFSAGPRRLQKSQQAKLQLSAEVSLPARAAQCVPASAEHAVPAGEQEGVRERDQRGVRGDPQERVPGGGPGAVLQCAQAAVQVPVTWSGVTTNLTVRVAELCRGKSVRASLATTASSSPWRSVARCLGRSVGRWRGWSRGRSVSRCPRSSAGHYYGSYL